MPSRIIHDKCRKSLSLNALSAEAERLFWRLTTAADDYGRFDADPRVLLGECFPYKIEIFKSAQVEKWRDELTVACGEEAPLVRLYSMKGRVYGYFVKWTEYQRDRSKEKNPPKPKFPAPEDGMPVDVSIIAKTVSTPPEPAAGPAPKKMPPSLSPAEMRFDQLWKAYPARGGVKGSKQATRALFLKLTEEEQAQCILATKAYARHCREQERTPRDAQRFIKATDGELWREFIPTETAPVRRPMSAIDAPPPARPPVGEDMPAEIAERFKRIGRPMPMEGHS